MDRIREALTQYLDEMGCRKTPERYAVLEAAYAYRGPFTVDDLRAVVQEKFTISRATTYNNLELLTRAGLVVKLPLGGGTIEYEACREHRAHHHIVCSVCGSVSEFADDTIEQALANKRFRNFKMTSCVVNVYGICSKCQGKLKREKIKQKQEELERERQKQIKKQEALRKRLEERKRKQEERRRIQEEERKKREERMQKLAERKKKQALLKKENSKQ